MYHATTVARRIDDSRSAQRAILRVVLQAFLTHEALSEIARVTVQNVGWLQSGGAQTEGTTQ